MDTVSLHKRANQVSAIFNVLATIVLVLGALGAIGVLVAMFGSDTSIGASIALLIGVVAYTILIWAGIQLSSIVAGYIAVRTTPTQ